MSRLIDLDNESMAPAEGGDARIRTAGIHKNIKFLGVELIDSPATDKWKGYVAAEFAFENSDGEQHTELYFQPATTAEDVAFEIDKFEEVNGKKVKTRKFTKEEMVTVVNNEFIYFLIDLADALGYPEQNAKQVLSKSKDFKNAVALFKKSFPAGKRTINMRLLFDNNKKKETSFLKLHYKGTLYYPFKADIFEAHVADRQSGLMISEWENTNCMTAAYKPKPKDSNNPLVNAGGAPVNAAGGFKAAVGAEEADPF